MRARERDIDVAADEACHAAAAIRFAVFAQKTHHVRLASRQIGRIGKPIGAVVSVTFDGDGAVRIHRAAAGQRPSFEAVFVDINLL